MYDKLPQKLKLRDDFCNCKFEMRNGRPSKVPYMVNGKRANPTDRRCFTSFEAACANLNSYDGIGIGVFDDLVAIDIDHCVVEGVPSEIAQDIIDTMNCYTENSPSGNGIRIICTASNLSYDKAKYYINNQAGVWLLLCFDSGEIDKTMLSETYGMAKTYTQNDLTIKDLANGASLGSKFMNATIKQLVDAGLLQAPSNNVILAMSISDALALIR
jgi:predicted transcriptional regulator